MSLSICTEQLIVTGDEDGGEGSRRELHGKGCWKGTKGCGEGVMRRLVDN